MRFAYIVDDDRVSRRVIQNSIGRDSGTLVRTFANGPEFLSEADELDPGVVLLDLNMPEMDGVAILERLREREDGKFVPVLVTGTATVPVAVLAMKQGAVDVIQKPFDGDMIGDAVTNAFDLLDAGQASISKTRDARRKVASLSPRESEVLAHLIDGAPNKVIAAKLGISPRTVEIYRAAAMKKLDSNHLAQAIRIAVAAGFARARSAHKWQCH
jgi:two-component system response regulator FixJ